MQTCGLSIACMQSLMLVLFGRCCRSGIYTERRKMACYRRTRCGACILEDDCIPADHELWIRAGQTLCICQGLPLDMVQQWWILPGSNPGKVVQDTISKSKCRLRASPGSAFGHAGTRDSSRWVCPGCPTSGLLWVQRSHSDVIKLHEPLWLQFVDWEPSDAAGCHQSGRSFEHGRGTLACN